LEVKLMTTAARALIILGFCAASIGAAGLRIPPTPGETLSLIETPLFSQHPVPVSSALTIFICGTVALVTGGILLKVAKKSTAAAGKGGDGTIKEFAAMLEGIRGEIQAVDDSLDKLTAEEFTRRIDELLKNQYLDLTLRNEELAGLLGFSKYAKIWDGVASAERLLSRAWSMATDGHLEEAIEELPRARTHIERACDAMAESCPPSIRQRLGEELH
jgi:hypothetical protein